MNKNMTETWEMSQSLKSRDLFELEISWNNFENLTRSRGILEKSQLKQHYSAVSIVIDQRNGCKLARLLGGRSDQVKLAQTITKEFHEKYN